MAGVKDRDTRTAQKLVRYEALFTLLDEIQRLDDIGAIALRAARQWKYVANVACWRLLVDSSGRRVVIDAVRGEATVVEGGPHSTWDQRHWEAQRPRRIAVDAVGSVPELPAHLFSAAVCEVEVMPFARQGEAVGLLTVAARHRPFDDLDHTFNRMLGGYLTDRIADILLREQATDTLMTRATRDSLTGLLNRGAIVEQVTHCVTDEGGEPVGIILADVDHFKTVNDGRGHAVGDEVLCEVSRRLQLHAPGAHGVGRYGGEEFLVVLHPCTPDQAARVAERLRAAVGEVPIQTAEGEPVQVTVSFGTASTSTVTRHDADRAVADLVKRADEALYRAKLGGRNQVCGDADT